MHAFPLLHRGSPSSSIKTEMAASSTATRTLEASRRTTLKPPTDPMRPGGTVGPIEQALDSNTLASNGLPRGDVPAAPARAVHALLADQGARAVVSGPVVSSSDALTPLVRSDVPAGAYDDHLAATLPLIHNQRQWTPADGPMPSLFVSHGAPFTLDDPQWLGDLFGWSASLPKPRAIVVVSAHWEDASATITGAVAGTPLFHDFHGFPPRYKTLRYATPDAGDLAGRLRGLLHPAPVHELTDRGLDHGAYIPLMAMYPAADVPVVQLSMPSLDPAALLRLGARLQPLREEGILVLGSGFMTHTFAVFRHPRLATQTAAFDQWAAASLDRGDVDALADYRTKAPGADVAHPTAEHFVPLLLTVGAASDPSSARTAIERMVMGNSIRSMQMT